MRPRQKVSRQGLALIEAFEGLRKTAARLPDGRWTLGYGHTKSAREGAHVSPQDAEALLLFDLIPVVEAVNGLIFTPLNQNEFDALCAFTFNVGVEALRSSDVLKRVNEGRLTEAACEIDLWRKGEVDGDPLVLDGLVRRRTAEKALFLTPLEGHVPIPSVLVRPTVDVDAPEVLPTSRPVETEASLEGPSAELHRTDVPAEAEPQPAPELPSNVVTAVFAFAEAVVVQSAPEPVVHAGMPSADAISYFAEGPQTAAPAVEPEPEPEPAPVQAAPVPTEPAPPAAEHTPPTPAAPAPATKPWPEAPRPMIGTPPMRTVAETVTQARIYGPMAAAALGRNQAARPANEDRPAEPKPEPVPSAPVVAPEPVTFQPGPPPPIVVPAAAPAAVPQAPQPEPQAQQAPTPEPQAPQAPAPPPLVLTHPPEDAPVVAPEPQLQSAPEAATDPTLFQEGWGGGEPTRVVRHEATPADETRRGSAGPYFLMAIIGLVAFAGAVAAFFRGRDFPGMTVYAGILAFIGVACVAVSVFVLLGRIGGED